MVNANEQSELEAVSKLAFTKQHRLTIASALLKRDKPFDKNAIAQATGVPVTTVYTELQTLCRLGALSSRQDGNRVSFALQDSPFWAWCIALIAQTKDVSATPGNGTSSDFKKPDG